MTSSTRRIFPIADWASAQEALYPERDNDSSIDTLPCPTKHSERSVSVSVSALSSASVASPAPRRSATKRLRSMSLSWRPKSVALLPPGDLESRFHNLSLKRIHTEAEQAQAQAQDPLASFESWSGFTAPLGGNSTSRSSHGDYGTQGPLPPPLPPQQQQQDMVMPYKGKGKKSMSGMWRRASVSIKGLVHRRTSIATETLDEPYEITTSKRQQRFSHVPSRSHHLFPGSSNSNNPSSSSSNNHNNAPASPSSPATSPRSGYYAEQQQQHQSSARPTTSHTINATWHRLRNATSFRHSRVLYGDFSLPQHGQQQLSPSSFSSSSSSPTQTEEDDSRNNNNNNHYYLPHSVPRPGLGNEPPVIPRNTGSGARAAVAAWQHEMFSTTASPLRNKRLTLDSAQNDRESGIGIAVTSTDPVADAVQDLDMVTPDGEVVLGACAPNRVDFISRLPVELAIQVLAHLDAAGLAIASRISTRWHDVTSLQHIWRDSYLREKTGTFATSEPIRQGTGLGVPLSRPNMDWKDAYRATEELAKRWRNGKATSIYLHGHSDSIYCLQFDEQKIITGSRDKTIRIWDMKTMTCKVVIGPPEVVKSNAILCDSEGKPTHSATFEPHIGADARSKRVTSVPTTMAFPTHHKASILCLQYDEDILVTGSSDASCIVYDMKGGYRPIRRLRHHTAAVLDLCFDDKYIVTCSKDISICVWDRATGELLKQLRGHSGPVNAVQMRGNTIVSCSGDFRVKLWNIETGKQIREFQGHTKGLACCQFSEDGRYVASAGNDKVIRIWDANTGECLREMKAHESLVRSLHIDSVSGRLVSGSYDTDIKVFDMETGRQLLDFPRWHASWVLSAKSDYRRIVSTGQDPKILVMDFGAGIPGIEQLESCPQQRKVEEVKPDPLDHGGYI